MKNNPENEQAYPHHHSHYGLGLTKREYFAGLIAASLLPNIRLECLKDGISGYTTKEVMDIETSIAVHYADKLIEELSK